MNREALKQSIIEHLERETGLAQNQVEELGPSLIVRLGFPGLLQYHFAWTGERYRFCCGGLLQPNAWTGVGIEAARAAAALGKGAS